MVVGRRTWWKSRESSGGAFIQISGTEYIDWWRRLRAQTAVQHHCALLRIRGTVSRVEKATFFMVAKHSWLSSQG